MTLRIATWNVNSVRLRTDHMQRFVANVAPDVLCLQEIKCQTHEFPMQPFIDAGYPYFRIAGQKGWHGVAIASRLPIADAPALNVCRESHARCVGAVVAGVEIQNFYIPAGGDVPDAQINAKFAHKLDFIARLTALMAARDRRAPLVICGDLNVAPGEFDVFDHKFMTKVVSHTPIEIAAMAALQDSLDFVDLVRKAVPDPQKLFSWWSYRAADFRASNRGLRLDHIWATPGLAETSTAARVHDDVRDWQKPSDHAPVSADFA